jgi:anaerobic magnesium-protoporphyrin IX monomethyl ester cyclase
MAIEDCAAQTVDRSDVVSLVTHAAEDTIKTHAWFMALHMASLEPPMQAAYLTAWIDKISTAATPQRFAIDQLFHHVEAMTAADQQRYFDLYIDAAYSGASAEKISALEARLPSVHRESTPALEPPAPSDLAAPTCRADDSGSARPLIALVVPQFLSAYTFLQPPICMLLGAARLRRAGYDVLFIDNRVRAFSLPALARAVAGADVIVVTTTPYDHIQNYFLDYRLRHAFATVTALKMESPRTPLVVCGAHGTVRPDIVLRDTLADIVLKGEFDLGIAPLVDRIVRADALTDLPHVSVRGTFAGSTDRQGAVSPHRLVSLRKFEPTTVATDDIVPAYDLIDFDNYYGDGYEKNRPVRRARYATALATRGCAYNCSFCYNFWDRKVIYRDPGAVVEELVWLDREHDVHDLFFLDFHFTQNRHWVAALCAEMRRKSVRCAWSAQARSDAADPDMLDEMASAGCEHLWFGVESYDPGVLRRIEKYRTPEVTTRAIANCRRVGIEPHQFILIGLPGETRASISTTLAAMHEEKAPYCGVMVATPRFGTEYYTLAKQQYPQLGNDFYSLQAVRGLVDNDLTPSDLDEALSIFNDRTFIYRHDAPSLTREERTA